MMEGCSVGPEGTHWTLVWIQINGWVQEIIKTFSVAFPTEFIQSMELAKVHIHECRLHNQKILSDRYKWKSEKQEFVLTFSPIS